LCVFLSQEPYFSAEPSSCSRFLKRAQAQEKDKTIVNQPDTRMAASAQSPETVNPGGKNATVSLARTGKLNTESQQTHGVDSAGNHVSLVEVSQDTNLEWAKRRSWMVNSVSFLLGMLEMVLILRFFFRLLGTGQDKSVLLAPYNLSQVFVAPFHGIFHDQVLGTHSIFELSTLIAMVVFALLGWGLVALSCVIFAPNGRQRAISRQR
jgi:hypothetical protein